VDKETGLAGGLVPHDGTLVISRQPRDQHTGCGT
jgi:hypothetical protein